jgi:hypothetical protein
MRHRNKRVPFALALGLLGLVVLPAHAQWCLGPDVAITDAAGGFFFGPGGSIIGQGHAGSALTGLFPLLPSSVCENIIEVQNVGDIIPCPTGAICTTQPTFAPVTRAYWHSVEQKLYANELGILSATWSTGTGVIKQNYQILNDELTVHFFRSDDPPYDGPPVELTDLIDDPVRPVTAVFRYNSTIQGESDAWIEVLAAKKELRARKTGTVVLEYNDTLTGALIDFEVIRILDPLSGTERRYDSTVDVGTRLEPNLSESCVTSESGCTCGALVATGIDPGDPSKTFAFQHTQSAPGAGPTLWDIYAIKPTAGQLKITVYWFKQGKEGVCWPTEKDRYAAEWPAQAQLNLRGIPASVPELPAVDMAAHDQAAILYQDPPNHASISNLEFNTIAPGVATVLYTDLSAEGYSVSAEAVETVDHATLLSTVSWEIGDRIWDASHEPTCNDGFLFLGSNYDPTIYDPATLQGSVFAVNTGQIEMWWYQDAQDVCWPVKPVTYNCDWPAVPDDCLIISTEEGVGPFPPTKYLNPSIYELGDLASDPSEIGFNPNEEHAEWVTNPGDLIYAARDDLNPMHGLSEPYVLLKYQDHLNGDQWEFDVFRVVRELPSGSAVAGCSCDEASQTCTFEYPRVVAQPLQPPAPLAFHAPYCPENRTAPHTDLYVWDDQKASPTLYFSRGEVTVIGEYWENWRSGGCEPWLDDGTGDPIDVTYDVRWPQIPSDPQNPPGSFDVYRKVEAGETVILEGFGRAEILYNEAGASLIVPFGSTEVPLSPFPGEFVVYSNALPPDLRTRLDYAGGNLIFQGDPDEGLLGIMSERDRDILISVYQETFPGHPSGHLFVAAINDLYAASQPVAASNVGTIVDETGGGLALASGSATQEGWVVLGFNGGSDIAEPSSVYVFRVECPLFRGEIQVTYPDCPFDEQVTLRWSGDCGGDCGDMDFYWQVAAGDNPDDYDDIDPDEVPTNPFNPWEDYVDPERSYASGWVRGQSEITIRGANIRTLTDNWFQVRTRIPVDATSSVCPPGTASSWTDAQLAEGWMKRVKRGINPFDQRVKDFTYTRVATYVSMIEQLGVPLEDVVGLSCDPETVNGLGLIEIYQAVLQRGKNFTIDLGVNYAPANQALILMAGTVADFDALLGNEAYGDAQDPTVAIDVNTSADASILFCFDNMVPSLIEEELALLRGRDDEGSTPVYNRLVHNFTLEQGQIAYKNNYNIVDKNGDGFILADDAAIMFPQGHGDAWGYYLSALKFYYDLRRDPSFDWPVRSEYVLVNNEPVEVSYRHERKFARIAAAKAKCGAEIVNLTYRQQYVEDPTSQWQGYEDPVQDRHWGVSDWAKRAFVGAYFDWVTVNSAIPSVDDDPSHIGTVKKVDRTTVADIREISVNADAIRQQLDQVDAGLNPLGLAKNVVPFDIDPSEDLTHFEQIAARAAQVLSNAVAVFNYANQAANLLRRNQDEYEKFEDNVEDREADFNSRLIEVFGLPYPQDVNPLTGLVYGSNFNGPDLFHYDYVDTQQLIGLELPDGEQLIVQFRAPVLDASGTLSYQQTQPIAYRVVPGFGLVKPAEFTQERPAPGEVQLARSSYIQALWRLQRALTEYDNALADIEDQADLLRAEFNLQREELRIRNESLQQEIDLNNKIRNARTLQLDLRRISRNAVTVAEAFAEMLPLGIDDWTSFARGAEKLGGVFLTEFFSGLADGQVIAEMAYQHAKSEQNASTNIELIALRQEFEAFSEIRKLEQMIRSLSEKEIEIYSLIEALNQAGGRYQAAVQRGLRVLEDRTRFRQQTAESVSNYRYKDMAFRIFRNDALQKYRAQFDLAARYLYLAAKAYGYETNLLHSDSRSGEALLEKIVRERTLGKIQGGIPIAGSGLAGIQAQVQGNFDTLKGILGFNNPTVSQNKFSLRRELFRIKSGLDGSEIWREQLRHCIVDDLRTDVPEFRQYCTSFTPYTPPEPAIVIEFETMVQADRNFFGWEASTSGGEGFFPSDFFSIKMRSIGVWFTNYNDGTSGLTTTPRVYLIPVGSDVMREPSDLGVLREWNIVDQVLPLPFALTSEEFGQRLNGWVPMDQLGGTLLEPHIRRHRSVAAYHDGSDVVDPGELTYDTSLVARSVWNTRWLLIIPGRFLLPGDPALGVSRFIERDTGGGGVTDIRLAFQTYQYSSSLGKPADDGHAASKR